jgi:hypothetical protein
VYGTNDLGIINRKAYGLMVWDVDALKCAEHVISPSGNAPDGEDELPVFYLIMRKERFGYGMSVLVPGCALEQQ